jgi:methylglyoxal synthase
VAEKMKKNQFLCKNFFQMKYTTRKINASKRIALIAHDHKKDEIIEWAIYNKVNLKKHTLIATGTTGRLLEEALDVPVQCLMSGPLGGDQQIGAMIAEGNVDIMIFFWDPMEAQPHDPDIKALLRLGVVWNIPMACDRATADFLMTSPLMHTEYDAMIPDYKSYVKREVKYSK